MSKTTFGSGVIITSKFLNGAKVLRFDGKDEDWHYQPLTLEDIKTDGVTGFDNRYVTASTEQIVSGPKTFIGSVNFGSTGANNSDYAPKSLATNAKWLGGTLVGDIVRLEDEDLVTKVVLEGKLASFKLRDLGDFACSSPANGTMIRYDSGLQSWNCTDTIDGGTY